jgi:hypothetical protein
MTPNVVPLICLLCQDDVSNEDVARIAGMLLQRELGGTIVEGLLLY